VKAILKSNFPFLIPYAVFLLLGALLLAVNSKADIHLEFNAHHNSFFDSFFYYLTYLGDGWTATIIFILLLNVRLRHALVMGLSVLVSALITQTLKHTIFEDLDRPKKFFEGLHDLYFVPGVENWLYNSFPSGHTTCAFAVFFSVALCVQNRFLKLFCFLLAFFIGYSRIYLSQHFFQDVYTGSIIGTLTTLVIFYLIGRSRKSWLDRNLISAFQ
jgi:membrane-associated phospholipid phosphatase